MQIVKNRTPSSDVFQKKPTFFQHKPESLIEKYLPFQIYGFLLSTGQFIYGNMEIGFFLFSISVLAFFGIYKLWK